MLGARTAEKDIPYGALHSFAPEELPQMLEQTVRRCLAKHEQIQEARLQDMLREEHVPLNESLVRMSNQIANNMSSALAREETAVGAKLDELEAKVDRLLGIFDVDWRARSDILAEQTRDIVSAVVTERTAPMMRHLERLNTQRPLEPAQSGKAAEERPARLTRSQRTQTHELLPETPRPAAEGRHRADKELTPTLSELMMQAAEEAPVPPPLNLSAVSREVSAAPGDTSPRSGGVKSVLTLQHPWLKWLQRDTSDVYLEQRHSIQEYKLKARSSSWFELMVHSYWFEAFFVAVIVLHLIVMVIHTDRSFGAPQSGADYILSETCFVIAYTIELAMKLVADGPQIFCGPQLKTNLMDAFLIVIGCVDIISHLSAQAGLVSAMALKGVRMIRLQKMLRLHKLFGMSNDTQLILHGLGACSGVLLGAALIVFLYFLIGSIFFTQAVSAYVLDYRSDLSDERLDTYERLFGTVFQSMFTMYQGLATGGDWTEFYDALKPVWSWEILSLVFIVFHFVYAVLMVNVVSSVYVQKILLYSIEQSQSIRFRMQKNDRKDTKFILEECERKFGVGDTINYKEFLSLMHSSDEVRELFDVRAVAVEDAAALHRLLARKPPGEDAVQDWMYIADRRRFFDICMRMKRDVSTTDVARSSEEFHRFAQTQLEHRDRVEAALAVMKTEISSISYIVKWLRSAS